LELYADSGSNNKITVRRHFTNDTKVKDVLTLGAESIIGRKKVNEYLEGHFGLPVNLLFRFMWSRQGELAWLLSADTNDMYSFFSQLYGLERFDKLRKELQEMQLTIPTIAVPADFSQKQAITDYAAMLKSLKVLEEQIIAAGIDKAAAADEYMQAKTNAGKMTSEEKRAKREELSKKLAACTAIKAAAIKRAAEVEQQRADLTTKLEDLKKTLEWQAAVKHEHGNLEVQLAQNQDVLRNLHHSTLVADESETGVCELCATKINDVEAYGAAKRALLCKAVDGSVAALERTNEVLVRSIATTTSTLKGIAESKPEVAHRIAATLLHDLETETKRAKTTDISTDASIVKLKQDLDTLEKTSVMPAGQISEADARARYETADDAYTQLVREKARLEEEAKQFKARSASNISAVKQATVYEGLRDRLISIRRGCHKDNVPAKLMRSKLARLSAKLQEMCAIYDLPFSLNITENRQFMFEKDGMKASIDKLSGGELSLASGCLQIALAEIASIDTGIYMFDEPSVFLTEENIGVLAAMFETLSTNARARGAIILLPTHEEAFERCSDTKIQF
ncbi:MAG: hypothetical protein WC910_09025, partial [Bacteroidales bacterium]